MTDPATRPSRWGAHAALSGILACGIGALLCITQYVALPGAHRLDWSRMPIALALFVLVCGTSIGLCIGGTTLVAARRRAGVLGLTLAGALGGMLAGIAPGILGIAGFGSLSAPYAGTANILTAILAGAISFVALWSPHLGPADSSRGALTHLGRSALASVISLGAFGMMAWSLAGAFDLVPTFDQMADAALCMGLLPFAVAVGAALGAVGGAAVGAACGLVVHTTRHHA